ncbi:hypothetical protein Tco_0312977 [Tanacetum coccineum]
MQQPNPDDSPVEQVATSPTKKKKATRNRQKRVTQTEPAPRQTAWTTEEEIVLAKGWHSVSENSERGNARKKDGFWVVVFEYVESETKQKGTSCVWTEEWSEDEDYYSKAMISLIECGLPFKFCHCWRHKSSGSSSFNAESRDASINLNNIVNDEDDVQEIRRPEGQGQSKNKGLKLSGRYSNYDDDA